MFVLLSLLNCFGKFYTQIFVMVELSVATFGQIATSAFITFAKERLFCHINKKKLKSLGLRVNFNNSEARFPQKWLIKVQKCHAFSIKRHPFTAPFIFPFTSPFFRSLRHPFFLHHRFLYFFIRELFYVSNPGTYIPNPETQVANPETYVSKLAT